jgi:hypothetical protein
MIIAVDSESGDCLIRQTRWLPEIGLSKSKTGKK